MSDSSDRTGAAVQVRLEGPLFAELENWRRAQSKIIPRSWALRELLERALADGRRSGEIVYPMSERRRLPMRRMAVALELEHGGHRFRLQIGRYADGALGEVFVDMHKGGSTLDAFAADVAILISLLLQYGASPAEIGHALRRAPNGDPASLIGAVTDRLRAVEATAW
jgi:ribonucleoside-diphosphate reductase alpha chain